MEYIDQYTIEQLLGRSLTALELNNFDLYLEITITRIEDLMCRSLDELLEELGKEELPADLKLVIARIFGVLGAETTQEIGVESKEVEDFRISYNDNINKIYALVVQQNASTIYKYSKCINIRSGRTIREDCRYYDNLR